MASTESAVTYSSYLNMDQLLQLQCPLSDGPEHDELLFIIIHQSYELWFKSILHELARAQRVLECGDTHTALGPLGRVRTIMKVLVSQVDILETMTPLQFNSFRDRLDAASGFQSAQFRQLEAIFGRSFADRRTSRSSYLCYELSITVGFGIEIFGCARARVARCGDQS